MSSIREKSRTDGTVVYHTQVRIKGSPPVTETFLRKSDAKRWAAETEAKIRRRRHFRVFEAQRHTAAEMIERFIKDELPKRPKQRRDLISHLTWSSTPLASPLSADERMGWAAGVATLDDDRVHGAGGFRIEEAP